ncbi:MAG: hypothetical protein WBF33_34415 [Candidatus Nitrosopolaris sp.]|jgi:hypothetical protein
MSKYVVQTRRTLMTYILGAKCVDGVVLIADMKVTYPDGRIEYQDKLSRHYYPIVLGGAGSTPMLGNFTENVLRDAQNVAGVSSVSGAVYFNPIKTEHPYHVDYNKFIRKIEETVMTLDQRYRNTLGDMRFDALIATQTVDRGALLHYVYGERINEPINQYKVLGTGEPYGTIFLNRFWNKEKSMEEIAQLGHFIIRYIEKFELNSQIGGGSQIWFVPNKGELYIPSPNMTEEFDKNTEERLVEHSKSISNLDF